ncbi:TPA: type II toxin-antitoxin system RelE/ParE family toxin [Elizabethkingia anophelis]
MSYDILSIPLFDKQAKRMAKKYPSFKQDLIELLETLTNNPELGTALGNNFYKIRLAISSKGKGKSGGARLITYVKVDDNTIYLTSIYDKSEKDNITDNELKQIFKLL